MSARTYFDDQRTIADMVRVERLRKPRKWSFWRWLGDCDDLAANP
jgi:hypothetical protein